MGGIRKAIRKTDFPRVLGAGCAAALICLAAAVLWRHDRTLASGYLADVLIYAGAGCLLALLRRLLRGRRAACVALSLLTVLLAVFLSVFVTGWSSALWFRVLFLRRLGYAAAALWPMLLSGLIRQINARANGPGWLERSAWFRLIAGGLAYFAIVFFLIRIFAVRFESYPYFDANSFEILYMLVMADVVFLREYTVFCALWTDDGRAIFISKGAEALTQRPRRYLRLLVVLTNLCVAALLVAGNAHYREILYSLGFTAAGGDILRDSGWPAYRAALIQLLLGGGLSPDTYAPVPGFPMERPARVVWRTDPLTYLGLVSGWGAALAAALLLAGLAAALFLRFRRGADPAEHKNDFTIAVSFALMCGLSALSQFLLMAEGQFTPLLGNGACVLLPLCLRLREASCAYSSRLERLCGGAVRQ